MRLRKMFSAKGVNFAGPQGCLIWIDVRNGDEITSTTMHHSFKVPLPDLKS